MGLAVGLSGLAFGTTAVTSGLSVPQACALSLIAFTGASQFALVGVVAGGGNLVAGTAGALLLGGRNGLYGLRLSRLLALRGPRKLAGAQFVIDETTAVALAQPAPAAARTGFFTTAIALYLTWNLTTLAGAAGAEGIGDPATFGLDAVGPAVFLALLWPQLRGSRARLRVALGGAAIALLATPMLPPGLPVLLAAAAAVLAGSLPPEEDPAADGDTTDGRARDAGSRPGDAVESRAEDAGGGR